MNLERDEVTLFYDLYAALLSFVNRKLKVSAETFSDAQEYMATPPKTRVAVRDALFEQRELIDEFVAGNPAGLSPEKLEIVGSWKHALRGEFYVFRYLKKYTVFLTTSSPPARAYGVLGLVDPMQEIMGPHLPIWVLTVLLPFRGKIIYDGLASAYNITFGGGTKRILNEEYKRAKETFGIITSLGDQPAPSPEKKKPRKRTRRTKTATAPRSATAAAKAIAEEVIEMTDAFCREFLNEEYAELCRELAGALARKRPSPLFRGRVNTWAAGVVRAIGWVNFLHDPGQDPHMALYSIDDAFGISPSTGAAKLKEIRTMFRMCQFDPKWTLPSKMDDNPLVWMLEINGFPMDIRYSPREVQEMAFAKGLIPYIPADRAEAEAGASRE